MRTLPKLGYVYNGFIHKARIIRILYQECRLVHSTLGTFFFGPQGHTHLEAERELKGLGLVGFQSFRGLRDLVM